MHIVIPWDAHSERLATDAFGAIEAIESIAAELDATKNPTTPHYTKAFLLLKAADAADAAAVTAAAISGFIATNEEATKAADETAKAAEEAKEAHTEVMGIIGNEAEAKKAAVAATEKAANATKEAAEATKRAAHIADVVHKDVVGVTDAAAAASGEWEQFIGTLPLGKKGIAVDAYNNSDPVEGWNEWIGTEQGYMDWGRDILNTAWKTAGATPGLAAGIAAAGVAGVAAASALGSNKAEPTQASTPQAPTPTHTNTNTPRPTQLPLHAGVQVGRPDGSLALHIDGPTMGTRAGAAKRQKTQ